MFLDPDTGLMIRPCNCSEFSYQEKPRKVKTKHPDGFLCAIACLRCESISRPPVLMRPVDDERVVWERVIQHWNKSH